MDEVDEGVAGVGGGEGTSLGLGEGQGDLVGQEGLSIKPQVFEALVSDLGEGIQLAGLEGEQAKLRCGRGGRSLALTALGVGRTAGAHELFVDGGVARKGLG